MLLENNSVKTRVGIIMGGMSSEKEVSLESGRNIFNKINRDKYEPTPLFLDQRGRLWEINIKLLMRNSTKDIEEDLTDEAIPVPYESLPARVDIVFLGLHGKYGEDGCIQGLLELLNVPYTGSGVLASALGMDKYGSRRLLSLSGIDVPKTIPVTQRDWDNQARAKDLPDDIERELGLPCVIKPAREGCSTAVEKIVAKTDIASALSRALVWDNMALVEEFIAGTEVTCGVIGYNHPRALTPSETIPTENILSLEDKFLYGQGENKTPARLPEEILKRIQESAVKTFSVLGLTGYARIDMFVRANGAIVVLEPNTLPGLTPSTVLFHQAAEAGLMPADLIDSIITSALEAHKTKRGPL